MLYLRTTRTACLNATYYTSCSTDPSRYIPTEGQGGIELLAARCRTPTGRGRGAAHVHALHEPRAVPPSTGHCVQQTYLHTEEQGVQSGHSVQQGGLVPDGNVRAAGVG